MYASALLGVLLFNTIGAPTVEALSYLESQKSYTSHESEVAPLEEVITTELEEPKAAEVLTTAKEILFVEATVPEPEKLLIENKKAVEVVFLPKNEDGVAFMADKLSNYQNVEAIHVISHGVPGQIKLGTAQLDASTAVGPYKEALQTIGKSLTKDGDILIYGCDFAAHAHGKVALEALATATGADIAASTDLTGHPELGGDWQFEAYLGQVTTDILFSEETQSSWKHVLPTITQSSNATTLANEILGTGVSLVGTPTLVRNNAGDLPEPVQSGTFSNFGSVIGAQIDSGVILSTGDVNSLASTTNTVDNDSDRHGHAEASVGGFTNPTGRDLEDPVVLTFDVVPTKTTLLIDLVFGSDEYNEFANGAYNDAFQIFVDGTNCALTADGQPISINGVNATNNAYFYNSNDPSDGTPTPFATEMDGFTGVATCRVDVVPFSTVTIELGLADDGDDAFNTWAMFAADSVRSEPPNDYGDAFDSYGTLQASSGASNKIVQGMYLGTFPNGDFDGFRDGTDDTGNATDDTDEGVATFPAINDTATTYSITVNATSVTGNNADVIGWIDFDGDGVFQSDEASNIQTLAGTSFEQDVTLTWVNIGAINGPNINFGTTYARVRIAESAEGIGITVAQLVLIVEK